MRFFTGSEMAKIFNIKPNQTIVASIGTIAERVERVRELHKPQEVWMGNYECVECSPSSCGCCSYVEYPCPTIKALDGDQ